MIDGQEMALSNLDKVFYKKAGVTKGDVIDYYRQAYPVMKRHLDGRPLTLHRYPDGVHEDGFYQKQAPDYLPDFVERVEIEKREDGKQQQIVCDSEATVAYLANLGTIEFHIWLSRLERLNYPDKMVFDLDPPHDDFEAVRQAALDLRNLLREMKAESYVMTTGSSGLHVAVSLEPEYLFDRVRSVVEMMASWVAAQFPEKYTTEVRKDKREGRLFLDIARNAYAQTSVAPYSLRSREQCSVAAPLDWGELHDSELHSRTYTIENTFRRLGQKDDPWKHFYDRPSLLGDLEERMEEL
jgi:bifunctional non-homologous end joining protein LigD